MNLSRLHDKREIEQFLRGNVYLHIYSIGDLDDLFWPYTVWYGLQDGGSIRAVVSVSVAGVHVYSATYGVAALGNIATLSSHRDRGYGKLVTARLCQSLSSRVQYIGLNVKASNAAAISCYTKLGFEKVANYGEFMVRRKKG